MLVLNLLPYRLGAAPHRLFLYNANPQYKISREKEKRRKKKKDKGNGY